MRLFGEGLACVRGARLVIEDVSFEVSSGAGLKLTGPNGAGKTTLLRTIAGFSAPKSGRLRLEGADEEKNLGEQCHFVAHSNAVKAGFTVRENLAFWQVFLAETNRGGELARVLARFRLDTLGDIPAGYLSAGQKRRLGLARLLVAERPVWLLDEPTVSLDRQSQDMLAEVVNEHLAAGGVVIAATHHPLGMNLGDELQLGARLQ